MGEKWDDRVESENVVHVEQITDEEGTTKFVENNEISAPELVHTGNVELNPRTWEDKLVSQAGIDEVSLQGLDPHEKIQTLLSVASCRSKDEHDTDTENTGEFAIEKIVDLIYEDPEKYCSALFAQLDASSPSTLSALKVIEDIRRELVGNTLRAKGTEPRAKTFKRHDAFSDHAWTALERIRADGSSKYLVQQIATLVLFKLCYTENDYLFEHNSCAFPISSNKTAVLTPDSEHLYVVNNNEIEQERNALGEYFDLDDFVLWAGRPIEEEMGFVAPTPSELEQFVNMHNPAVRGIIQEDFAIRVDSLSIPEQFCFLNYLSQVTTDDASHVQAFTRQHGQQALRSFLALEEDVSLGDTIIELGARLEKDTARKLFAKYSEIVDASEQAQGYVATLLKEGDTSTEKDYVASIAKNLRHKANDLLRDAHTSLTNDTVPELLKKLDRIKAENLLWAATFREATRAGVPLEMIRDTSLLKLTSEGLAEHSNDVASMRALLEKNYASYQGEMLKESRDTNADQIDVLKEFRDTVRNSFEEHLTDPKTHWYVLKHKEDVVGFNRFDEVRDDETGDLKELYFGSFNVERMQYGGNGIGNAILKASLEQESARGVPIRAHCDPRARISQKYLEWGFVATKTIDYAGLEALEIVMDKTQPYGSQKLTHEVVTALSSGDAGNCIWVERISSDSYPATLPSMDKLNEGYVLTRLVQGETEVTAVFEKP